MDEVRDKVTVTVISKDVEYNCGNCIKYPSITS